MPFCAPARRSVLAAAVWSVPAVSLAAAAPAFADSTAWACGAYAIPTSAVPSIDSPEGTVGTNLYSMPVTRVDADGATHPGLVRVETAFTGNTKPRIGENMRVLGDVNVKGVATVALRLQQEAAVAGTSGNGYQEITIHLPAGASQVGFTIVDIDSQAAGFWDRVSMNPTDADVWFTGTQDKVTIDRSLNATLGGDFTGATVADRTILGDGTPSDPWRMPVGNTNPGWRHSVTGAQHFVSTLDVRSTAAYPGGPITLRFANGVTSGARYHGIFIANIAFRMDTQCAAVPGRP